MRSVAEELARRMAARMAFEFLNWSGRVSELGTAPNDMISSVHLIVSTIARRTKIVRIVIIMILDNGCKSQGISGSWSSVSS